MPFDLDSAKPVEPGGGFDLASAKPVGDKPAKKAEKAPAPQVMDDPYLEALGPTVSGMIAKPISEVAGMAAIPMHAMGMDREPVRVRDQVREAMTYQPRTQAGAQFAQYNPMALLGQLFGKVGQWGGGQVNRLPVPPGMEQAREGAARGVEEAIPQGLGMLGMKAGPKVGAGAGDLLKGEAGSNALTARGMMQSALKPDAKAQRTGQAAKAVDTLLDEGVNVTRGGVDKLQDRISVLNDAISERIKNSPAVVNKARVGSRMRKLMDDFEKQVNPKNDLGTIQKAWEEFMDHPLLKGRDMPVQTAQELKQGTYRANKKKVYGELSGAAAEAQATLARGLKEEIAKAVPEVVPLNAQESKLLGALSLTEKRVLMDANKNPLGLSLLSMRPEAFVAFMADRSALFKSLVARMLNTGSKATPPLGQGFGAMSAGAGQQPGQLPPPPQQ